MISSPCVSAMAPVYLLAAVLTPPLLGVAAVSDCPVSAIAGEEGESLTVQVKLVVLAAGFGVRPAMTNSLSYWYWTAPPM